MHSPHVHQNLEPCESLDPGMEVITIVQNMPYRLTDAMLTLRQSGFVVVHSPVQLPHSSFSTDLRAFS